MDATWVTQIRDSNQDTVVNGNGDEILSWTRAGSLWILNGRCLPNVCTYLAKQGNSNCDTWLGTSWVLNHCFDGVVDGPVLESDHARLSVKLPLRLCPVADCAQAHLSDNLCAI